MTVAHEPDTATITVADLTRRVLAKAVELVTNDPASEPRPGQASLSADVAEAFETYSHAAGEGPTGTGKSLAYLAAAAAAAVGKAERTVVSTESLALQAQLVEKDLPTIASATEAVTGMRPRFAVLKGWSNYVCPLRLVTAAGEITGTEPASLQGALDALDTDRDNGDEDDVWESVFGQPASQLAPSSARDERTRAIIWGLTEVAAGRAGDRHSYPGPLPEDLWQDMSTSTGECVGVDDCRYGDVCPAAAARERAAAADIVVTNHSMLAVQATRGVPVVIGSRRLGLFRHVVVDEAHALPGTVRAQGASQMAGSRIIGAVRALRNVLDDKDQDVNTLFSDGEGLADAVDNEISAQLSAARSSGLVKLGDEDDPFNETGDLIVTWIGRASRMLSKVHGLRGAALIGLFRARARIEALAADLDAARTHEPGVARWIETDDRHTAGRPVVKVSPVEVAGMLTGRVWTADVPVDDETGDWLVPEQDWCTQPDDDSESEDRPRYPLTVTAVSATFPTGFARDLGLRAPVVRHPSPFTDAFNQSLLFVPRATDQADVNALTRPGAHKPVFDTSRHPEWAANLMVRLIEANSGSALVLAATTAAGRRYVEVLRAAAAGRWEVLSQWDGEATRRLVGRWRDDPRSVLVGTRSLMTGVDAPGDTCSLVVVDRVPRSAPNPVDDARVEVLTKLLDVDRFTADQYVYVTDAALLLEQAAGRLIRTASDRGMVAVLDPRLLKSGPFGLAARSRATYLDALRWFPHRTADEQEALRFLNNLNQ